MRRQESIVEVWLLQELGGLAVDIAVEGRFGNVQMVWADAQRFRTCRDPV